jgi:hypothetical protein
MYKYKYKYKYKNIFNITRVANITNSVSVTKIFASGSTSIVYYIRIYFKDGTSLYKIGYTSMSLKARVEGYYNYRTRERSFGMGLPYGAKWTKIAILYSGTREAAYRYEQDLHNLYQAKRYRGHSCLRNGNTELYLTDVLGLDKSISNI